MLCMSCQYLPIDSPKKIDKEKLVNTELMIIKNYLDKGEPRLAWEQLRQLDRKFPNHPDILNVTGLTHLTLKNHINALKSFKKAYKIYPKVTYALNLSSAYISIGKFKKARTLLVKIIKNKSDYEYRERLWHNLALTYEKEKKYRSAIKFYKKANQINPNFILSMINLGKLYKIIKNDRLAENMFQKTISICKNCYEPVHELAVSFINKGKFTNAVSILERYIKMSKKSGKDFMSAQKLLNMAQTYVQRQKSLSSN